MRPVPAWNIVSSYFRRNASRFPGQASSPRHPARGRLTRDDILFAKRTPPAGCRFLLILCAQEFLSVARRGAQISRRSEGVLFRIPPFRTLFYPFSSP